MRTKKRYLLLIRITTLLCYILLLVILEGCNGEDSPAVEATTNDLIPIEVSVNNINGWQVAESASSRSLLLGDTVPALSITDKAGVLSGLIMINRPPTKITHTSTRVSLMGTGIRFRIVVYKCATAAIITTANFIDYGDYQIANNSGTALVTKALLLQEGTYTFVCYSYGDGSLPTFNQSVLTLPVTHGQDFMTCIKEGVRVTSYGKSYLLNNIRFSHRCARLAIRVAVDTQKMAAITACSATLGLPSSAATYTFTTNDLAVNATTSNMAVTWTTPNGTSVLSNNVYVLPQAVKNLSLTLNSTIGDKNMATISATINGQILLQQTAYECEISLNTPYYIVGGSIWAWGNLRYTGGTYQFYPQTYNYSYDVRSGDYFPWNKLTPDAGDCNPPPWNDTNDPCKKVAPANTWRTPTEGDATKLVNTGCEATSVSGVNGYIFGKVLFLPLSGYFAGLGQEMMRRDQRGLYWTTGYGEGYGFFLSFTDSHYSPNWASTDKNNSMCIRCIRN